MNQLVHRDDVRRFGIGVITVLVGLVIAYVGITVQGGGELPLRTYTTVKAQFDDVGTLKPSQKVTENGIRVGQITDIAIVDGAAEVTMRLDGDRDFYADATARVGNESALGKKFIDLDPGTKESGPLAGDLISTEQTDSATSLDDVFAPFDDDARAGLRTALSELGGGFSGHATDINDMLSRGPELLKDGTVIVDTLAAPGTNLDDLLVTAESLVGQFRGQSETLATLVEEAGQTLQAVNVDQGAPLRVTLDQLPEVLRTAKTGLKAINPPLVRTARAVQKLAPGVDRLVDATPDLRGFMTESPPVARTVKQFTADAEEPLEKLVPAVTDLRPVVDRLQRTLTYADPLLTTLKPYWADFAGLGAQHDLLSGHYNKDQHYFSAQLTFPGIYTATLPDPFANYDPYPGPGNAFKKPYDNER
ncbi:MlaD family protein [Nocardioides daejeonensis]|uniref:MlaD family protein n=1 Tax=Nocardioides daejeonensis TaxID=1046556 RepID=UPI000D746730|nr:MlaD family protein [Nocardioides daejeonensis]